MTDIFQEVESDLRSEAVARLWRRYGMIALGVFVLAVAIASIVVAYDAYRSSVARGQSDKFQAALDDLEQKGASPADRVTAFETLSQDLKGGYKALAKMEYASALAAAERWPEAASAYEGLAADASLPTELRDLSALKAAILRADTSSLPDMQARIDRLAVPDNSYRFSAAEILGYVALKAGDDAAAGRYFALVLGDPQAPPDLVQRVEGLAARVAARAPARPAEAASDAPSSAPSESAPTGDAPPGEEPAQDPQDAGAAGGTAPSN